MEKSLFAGITILGPDESILSDDGAFIGRDREVIDKFLEIGAKTHRHTGLPGLDNPQLPLGDVEAIPSGGVIAGDTTFQLAYTLVDQEGGETLPSPATTVTTPAALEQPLYAPTAEMDYTDGGTLMVETYYYTLTFIDSEGGETPPGAWASIEREPGFPNARVLLSDLDSGVAAASAAGWRLYRAVGGGTFDYLSSGGTGEDTFADDGSLSVDCDIHPPPDELNTTNNINQLRVVLPGSAAVGSASGIRLYGTNTGLFLGDVLMGTYPAGSAGQTDFFTSFDPQPGAPPDRNHSIGGASQIDPDTDILDWHWKRPVATAGDLPAGDLADVRLVEDEDATYLYTGSHWMRMAVASDGRMWASASGVVVGSGGNGTIDLDLIDLDVDGDRDLLGARLLKASTSHRARVRVYGRSADRAAANYALADQWNTAQGSGMVAPVAPAADVHNLDEPVDNKLYLAIDNFDQSGVVTVAFLILPTEYA